MKTIEEQWDDYAGHIFDGVGPSELQVIETKKAFFAGAFSILTSVMDNSLADAPTGDAEGYLKSLYVESLAFHVAEVRRSDPRRN